MKVLESSLDDPPARCKKTSSSLNNQIAAQEEGLSTQPLVHPQTVYFSMEYNFDDFPGRKLHMLLFEKVANSK
jgi:hypothetical protein